jgi:hypothetical protein
MSVTTITHGVHRLVFAPSALFMCKFRAQPVNVAFLDGCFTLDYLV